MNWRKYASLDPNGLPFNGTHSCSTLFRFFDFSIQFNQRNGKSWFGQRVTNVQNISNSSASCIVDLTWLLKGPFLSSRRGHCRVGSLSSSNTWFFGDIPSTCNTVGLLSAGVFPPNLPSQMLLWVARSCFTEVPSCIVTRNTKTCPIQYAIIASFRYKRVKSTSYGIYAKCQDHFYIILNR